MTTPSTSSRSSIFLDPSVSLDAFGTIIAVSYLLKKLGLHAVIEVPR